MKLVTVLLSVGAAVSLAVATAGGAAAAPAPQVPGTVLAKALLPVSTFGSNWQTTDATNTGRSLTSPRGQHSVAGTSCATFQGYSFAGYGDTADAYLFAGAVDTDQSALEDVAQFASASAARAFFGQARQKYRDCAFYAVAGLEGYFVTALLSLKTTTVDGDPAFRAAQAIEFNTEPVFYQDTTIVLMGTDVSEVAEYENANTPVPAWILTRLIDRVQALYR
jgi:hypothetical protein